MKKLYVILASFFLFAPLASAEKIDWQTIVSQTMDKNPSIQSAKFSLENAKSAYNSTLSGFFPDITLNGSATQGTTSQEDINVDKWSRQYSFGANASLPIFSGFSTYNTARQKSADYKAAQSTYNRAVSDAIYNAATQYINLMWAYESVDLLKKIKDSRTENRDMIALKYKSGNVDLGSLKRVEADVTMSEFDLRKAQRYMETASAALLAAIGRNDNAVLEPAEKLPSEEKQVDKPDFGELIKTIPEYLYAQYSVQSAQAASAATKGEWFPEISLDGGISRFGSQWLPNNSGWNVGISASYPLFTGGKRISDVSIASNLSEMAQRSFANTQNGLLAQAVSNFNDVLDAYEYITATDNYLEASSLQAEISTKQYVNGLSTYQDWYLVQNDFITAQTNFLNAKKAAELARVKWNNFLGQGAETAINN